MPLQRIVALSNLMIQGNRSNIIINTKCQQYKCLTINRIKHTKVLRKEKERFRTYVIQRYVEYVKNYTKVLEEKFPSAMNMYRVFSIGIKEFLTDLKRYISLRIKLISHRNFSKMSREDIELYQKMPSDMWRIAPVLVLSAIPFGNYIVFPLAFLRPRQLLCSHFWSIQQKIEFTTKDLTERLRYNKPVFRALQAKMHSIPNSEIKNAWRKVVALLGSGVHPKPEDILACKQLFASEPYQLTSLTYAHMGNLLKMHGLRKSIFRRKKLKFKALMLMELDKAIVREGGVEALSTEELRYSCHIRGLNGSHLTQQEMKTWLEKWLQISKHVDGSTSSLLLHSPIFLAYNHPQNWVLIY